MRRTKRDYQIKKFNNPYFPKKTKRFSGGLKFLVGLGVLVLFFGLYFLNTSPWFKIKEITVSGNNNIRAEEIQDLLKSRLSQKRWLIFKQSSVFFFNAKAAKKVLNQEYFLDQLEIKKVYFSGLAVAIKEKTSILIWVSGPDKYYLSGEGKAIKKIMPQDLVISDSQATGTVDLIRPESLMGDYPMVIDQNSSTVAIGSQIIAPQAVEFILALAEEFAVSADFETLNYQVANQNFTEVTLITKEGWQAYFSLTQPAAQQAQLLNLVLKQKVKNRQSLQYIDLRFGEKIFYQ